MRYFHRPALNQKDVRWYTLHVQPDLFGGFDLVCRSGRIGRRKVCEELERFGSVHLAQRRLSVLSSMRLESGFVELDRHPAEHSQEPGVQLRLAWAGI